MAVLAVLAEALVARLLDLADLALKPQLLDLAQYLQFPPDKVVEAQLLALAAVAVVAVVVEVARLQLHLLSRQSCSAATARNTP